MILIEKDGTIASAAKDKELKFWYPPETWKKEIIVDESLNKVTEKEDVTLSDSSDEEIEENEPTEPIEPETTEPTEEESDDDELETPIIAAPVEAEAENEEAEAENEEDSTPTEQEETPVEEENTGDDDQKNNVFADDSSHSD